MRGYLLFHKDKMGQGFVISVLILSCVFFVAPGLLHGSVPFGTFGTYQNFLAFERIHAPVHCSYWITFLYISIGEESFEHANVLSEKINFSALGGPGVAIFGPDDLHPMF